LEDSKRRLKMAKDRYYRLMEEAEQSDRQIEEALAEH